MPYSYPLSPFRVALLPLVVYCLLTAAARAEFIKGVDLSILKAAEDGGVQFKFAGEIKDPVRLFKQNGVNYVRLRLFVDPSGKNGEVNTLAYTIASARRMKQAGLPVLLDIQYSDTWSNQRSQPMPTAWKGLTRPQLVAKVHDYTLETLKKFDAEGCLPDMVAIGNDLTNGFLWPAGGPMSSEEVWPQLIELLKSAAAGVRDATPPDRHVQIMLHLAAGDGQAVCEWFFGHCKAAGLDYDIIGLGFYAAGNQAINSLGRNLTALATKYDKDIVIVETSCPFTGEGADTAQAASPDGQLQFLSHLMQVVAETPNSRGRGVFYYEPTWIQSSKWGGPASTNDLERSALFDASGNALPALAAFWRPAGAVYPDLPQPPVETRTPASATTPVVMRTGNWSERHNDLRKLVAQHPDSQLIFVGDSILDVWQFQPSFAALFGKYNALDLGLSGDRTEHALFRLQNGELEGLHPKVAVVLIGTNNTVVDSPEWIAGGVAEVVKTLHQHSPQTHVLLLGLLPRDKKASKLRAGVEQTNALLAKLNLPDTTYLDIGQSFVDATGEIPKEIMADRLHPTPKGYDLFYDAIGPTLTELMR